MKKLSHGDVEMLTSFGCFIAILISSMIINAFTFPYAINFWLGFFGKDITIAWWQGVLIGFVPGIGQLSIAFAVVTWLLSLFLN